MSTHHVLFGDALRSSAQPWLDELGKSDRDRLLALFDLAIDEKTRLSDCLTRLYPGTETTRALADLTRLRMRLNDAADGSPPTKPDLGFRFHVDSKKKNPPTERFVWFTGPNQREKQLASAGRASVRTLERYPAFIDQQTAFVYNPLVDEKTKEVDFAILIALQEEFDFVYQSIVPRGAPLPLKDDTAYVFDWQNYKGCIACVGKMGPQAMADLSRSVIERFKPRLISVIGIAGGMDGGLRLGDVLVADQADDYLQTAKAEATGEDSFQLCFSGEAFPTTHALVSKLKNWRYDSEAAFAEWQQDGAADLDEKVIPSELHSLVGFEPRIAIGHIATGDVVGAATAFTRHLQKRDRKFAAIEMESAGMLSAVHRHGPDTLTLVLRGISDFADDRKTKFDEVGKGQFRRAAMRNATRLLLAALPRLLPAKPMARAEAKPCMNLAERAQRASQQTVNFSHAYIPNDSCPVGVGDVAKPGELAERQGRVPAADYILDWIKNGDSPFLAVLGEYGIGKTTTLKHITRRLLDDRANDPTLPLPIFIDLRENYLPYKAGDALPTLEAIIAESLRRNWKMEEHLTISAAEVLQLVRQQSAVIIFDGLDEKIVHMDSKMAQGFIRELWAALPPYQSGEPCRGKLILSCRSHYFPTITAQRTLLCGEGREEIRDNDYRACLVLPFSTPQIQAYLRGALGDERGDHAWEVITSIHNLEDLSSRPYLLGLITSQIESLELRRAKGETVRATTLYDGLVQQWLERDAGKHKFSDAHKRELMEHLAAGLWKDGVKEWPWSKVESWLEEFYAARPVWQARYAAKCDFELLLEDLRTATFIVRPETSPDHFRFAHTSLQEYFLACYLMAALREKRDAAWDMPVVSKETLDFLGQMIAQEPRRAECLASLERIIGGECLRAACLAFQYWLEAIKHGHPEPQPKHVNLAGAESQDWEIKGHSAQRPLNLRGANLRGIKLNRTRVQFVDTTGADLTGMEARQALFIEVRAPQARVVDCDVAGLQWRKGSLLGADVTGTPLGLAQLMQVEREHQTDPKAPDPDALAKRWISPRTGHTSYVSACAWSPDGQRLLSGSDDNTLKVWDAATGEALLTLTGHTSSVNACAWSPDGQRLLSGSDDTTIKVWDAATGEELLTLQGHSSSVRACAWSPDGSRLLSCSYDQTLKVWEAATGEALLTIPDPMSVVSSCAWSPDGKRLLSGSYDSNLKVWDAATGECLMTMPGHTSFVGACAWSPDGQRLLSGSYDSNLKVWDAATGEALLTLPNHTDNVSACAWSPDGKRLLSGSDDATIKVWDAATGEALLTLQGHSSSVRACAWSPDGSRLLSCSNDATIKVWDAATGEALLTLQGHSSSVRACAWSPDGSRLLSCSNDQTLKVWDAATGEALLTLRGHSNSVYAFAWSPDGLRLLSGSWDKTMKVWDAATGEALLTLQGHTSVVSACAWSPDGKRLLSCSDDNTLKVWDAATGEALLTLRGHRSLLSACAWSPDGRCLLSGSWDKTMKVWDAATGEALLTLPGHTSGVTACAWSPDGERLLSGSVDNTLKVWDAATGEALLTLTGHTSSVRACAWSPDGQRLLSGSVDNTLKVWDAATGENLLTLTGHTSSVIACAWSPDGKRLLSGSGDNTLKVRDAESGACLTTLHCLPEHQAAAISGDRQQVLSASPEAWRWLGWQTFDAEGRFLPCLPIEAFGPIPGLD